MCHSLNAHGRSLHSPLAWAEWIISSAPVAREMNNKSQNDEFTILMQVRRGERFAVCSLQCTVATTTILFGLSTHIALSICETEHWEKSGTPSLWLNTRGVWKPLYEIEKRICCTPLIRREPRHLDIHILRMLDEFISGLRLSRESFYLWKDGVERCCYGMHGWVYIYWNGLTIKPSRTGVLGGFEDDRVCIVFARI